MTELPALVDLVIVAGAVCAALAAIAGIAVKAYRAARRVDEHFRRRETDRIKDAAGELIDRAAEQLGGQLAKLGAQIEAIDSRQRQDHDAAGRRWAELELWRAGVDARLDLLDSGRRFPPHGALSAADTTS